MPTITVTPDPYGSTIFQLSPAEEFQHRTSAAARPFTVRTITVLSPDATINQPAAFILSGTRRPTSDKLISSRPLQLGDVAATLPPALRAPVQDALTDYIRDHAVNAHAARTPQSRARAVLSVVPDLPRLSTTTGPAASPTARRYGK